MIVCICHGISDRAIRKAVKDGADNVAKVRACTRAGSDCGQCACEIRELIDEQAAKKAAPSLLLSAVLV
jgi:bacterioferritin-associated ferredoxin